MVGLTVTPECMSDKHTDCDGGRKVPREILGGTICTCKCHVEEPVFKGEEWKFSEYPESPE